MRFSTTSPRSVRSKRRAGSSVKMLQTKRVSRISWRSPKSACQRRLSSRLRDTILRAASPQEMHGPLLGRLAEVMAVETTTTESIVWESLALANMLVGFAHSRRYAFQAIGAIGAVELASSIRAPKILRGLDRLEVPKSTNSYFRLGATIDGGHWQRWRDNHRDSPGVRIP